MKRQYLMSFVRRGSRRSRDEEIEFLKEFGNDFLLENNDDFIERKICEMIKFDFRIMEIGFGSGDHIISMAEELEKGSRYFIGCDPYRSGVIQLIKKINKSVNINNSDYKTNLAIWNEDARILLEKLPNGFLNETYILCPDPWPKTKHHKRRLINLATLDLLWMKTSQNGKVIMTTDHLDYGQWINEVVNKSEVTDRWSIAHHKLNNKDDCIALNVCTKYALKGIANGSFLNMFELVKLVT